MDSGANDVAVLRYSVHRLARRLRKQAADGLTPSQVSVLSTVVRRGTIRLGELARLEQVGNSTLTRLTAKLEAAGYVVRSVDPEDGRGAVITPTELGVKILRAASDLQDDYLADHLDQLDRDEKAILLAAGPIIEKLLGYRG